MKAYTDLEQSKKLAEILPIESADAFYDMAEPEKRQVPIIGNPDDYYDMEDWTIPCWSLAALIELMGECRMEKTPLDQTGEFTYSFVDDYYNIHTYEESNPVDAAVEMIYKLKEKNLL